MRRTLILIGLLLAFIFAISASPGLHPNAQTFAQERQLKQIESPVQTWPTKAKRWALVIGVDQYADTQITTLGGASNDAKSLAAALVRYAGFPAEQVTL